MCVLNLVFYIDQSWSTVSQKTITNFFRRAVLHSSPESEELSEDVYEDLLNELAEILRNRGYSLPTKICMQILINIALLTSKFRYKVLLTMC